MDALTKKISRILFFEEDSRYEARKIKIVINIYFSGFPILRGDIRDTLVSFMFFSAFLKVFPPSGESHVLLSTLEDELPLGRGFGKPSSLAVNNGNVESWVGGWRR